jgi:hypothetical protein
LLARTLLEFNGIYIVLVAASCANVGSKTLINLNDVPKSTSAAAA